MEEQTLLRENDIAITTHRVVWGKLGAIDLSDIDQAFVLRDDWWKGSATCAVIGVILIYVGATWSVIGGLLLFGAGYYFWKARSDKLVLVANSGAETDLTISNEPPGLASKVDKALRERVRLIREFNENYRAKSAQAALSEIDDLVISGTPQNSRTAPSSAESRSALERFEIAKLLWEKGISEDGTGNEIEDAVNALNELVTEEAPIPELYELTASVFLRIQGLKAADTILDFLKKAHELYKGNREGEDNIESQLFVLGKMCWDEGLNGASFAAYSQGLDYWVSAGNRIGQEAPLPHRIGFCVMRKLSKDALENGDNKMGVLLLDLCEKSEIDINIDIDVSDAKS